MIPHPIDKVCTVNPSQFQQNRIEHATYTKNMLYPNSANEWWQHNGQQDDIGKNFLTWKFIAVRKISERQRDGQCYESGGGRDQQRVPDADHVKSVMKNRT